MTTDVRQPIHVSPPVMRDGRPVCPRCSSRLLYDGAEMVCVACGYEYSPPDQELAAFLGAGFGRRSTRSRMLGLGGAALTGLALGRLSLAFGLVAVVVIGIGVLLEQIAARSAKRA
jgi:hypothetical protein